MDTERALLHAIHTSPADQLAWQALADWLEEQGQTARAELLRLRLLLGTAPDGPGRDNLEQRVQAHLAAGTLPYVPLWTNSIGMQFALIPPGSFFMGTTEDVRDGYGDERPRRRVVHTRAYYLGVVPVTQAQWQAVMGKNPSQYHGEGQPVECVAWVDCQDFCQHLSQQDGRTYRLPTEAEWERACRADTSTAFWSGGAETIERVGWCSYDGTYSSAGQTRPVGQYPANAWGLFDMHGNVWEWCEDRYGAYPPGESIDPQGPPTGTSRVVRGGSWYTPPRLCRSAYRMWKEPLTRYSGLGCRVCVEPVA